MEEIEFRFLHPPWRDLPSKFTTPLPITFLLLRKVSQSIFGGGFDVDLSEQNRPENLTHFASSTKGSQVIFEAKTRCELS